MKASAKYFMAAILALAGCTLEVHQDRITLDPPVLMVKTGESRTVKVNFLSGKQEDVEWYSSAESVASVSGGEVKGLSSGTSVITARTVRTGLLAMCEVTVREPSQIVSGITLDPTEVSLYLGDRLQLNATVLPSTAVDQSITWTSSDNSVATIGYTGYLVTWAVGSAIITATTGDGGYSASCKVTVLPEFIHVESVSIPSELEIKVGQSVTLTPAILPENATDKSITWQSYDESIVTVTQEGLVTGISAGMMYIDVTAADGGLRSKCLVIVRN